MQDRDFSAYDPRRVLGQAIERRVESAQAGAREMAQTAAVNVSGRRLTQGELGEIRWMFGVVPGVERARIYPRNFWWPFRNNRAMAPEGNIYFPSQDYHDDFSLANVPVVSRALFMHEATHLYQWYALGMWVWLRGPFDRNYDYVLEKGRPLRAYGLEQMGEIVQDYYKLRHGHPTRLGYPLSAYADALPVRR